MISMAMPPLGTKEIHPGGHRGPHTKAPPLRRSSYFHKCPATGAAVTSITMPPQGADRQEPLAHSWCHLHNCVILQHPVALHDCTTVPLQGVPSQYSLWPHDFGRPQRCTHPRGPTLILAPRIWGTYLYWSILETASFPGPRPTFHNPGNKEASGCKHMLGVHICPVFTVSKWLTVSKWWAIPMLNRKKTGNAEEWTALVLIRYALFYLDCHVITAYSNCF